MLNPPILYPGYKRHCRSRFTPHTHTPIHADERTLTLSKPPSTTSTTPKEVRLAAGMYSTSQESEGGVCGCFQTDTPIMSILFQTATSFNPHSMNVPNTLDISSTFVTKTQTGHRTVAKFERSNGLSHQVPHGSVAFLRSQTNSVCS
jgi:hypothetical protein